MEDPRQDREELEREIEELEDRVGSTLGEESTGRLHRMRRQVAEAAPDALFAPGGDNSIRGIARRTDSYGFVLILLAVLIWLFIPFASSERWATIPTIVVFFLTVLISMHTSFVRAGRLLVVLVIDAALLVSGVVGYVIDSDSVRAASNAGFGLLLIITTMVILRRVLQHRTITSRTLSGAVSAFLLVGLAFACFAESIVLRDPDAYAAASGTLQFADMVYFSFVTQATLGYGDIVPVSDWARSLATMQTIAGQIYLVTIVARLVSLLGMSRVIGSATASSPDQSQ